MTAPRMALLSFWIVNRRETPGSCDPRENRGYRAAGGGVIDAFYAGYSRVDGAPWDFVVKLDETYPLIRITLNGVSRSLTSNRGWGLAVEPFANWRMAKRGSIRRVIPRFTYGVLQKYTAARAGT